MKKKTNILLSFKAKSPQNSPYLNQDYFSTRITQGKHQSPFGLKSKPHPRSHTKSPKQTSNFQKDAISNRLSHRMICKPKLKKISSVCNIGCGRSKHSGKSEKSQQTYQRSQWKLPKQLPKRYMKSPKVLHSAKRKFSKQSQSSPSNNSQELSLTTTIGAASSRFTILRFVLSLNNNELQNIEELSLLMFDFVVRNRIIRDSQFQQLYRSILLRFPQYEESVKGILVDILTTLDG